MFEPTQPSFDVAAARRTVLDQIAHAAQASGRAPDDVQLVAVTKTQSLDKVEAIKAAGQTVFGENRVQEAQGRWQGRRDGVELRLIGPLQTNKVHDAVALFDVIETLDRDRLAKVLADAIQKAGRVPRLYVQVNTGEEPQKAGIYPNDADLFIASCRKHYGFEIEGLMCIPPEAEPPGPHFALLAEIAGWTGVSRLSMGMSADFETAIRFGATSVRVGSALFGPRA